MAEHAVEIEPQSTEQLSSLAFVVLTLFMCAHALLQTSRDALFLAKIPASNLPWVTLLVVALVLVLSRAQKSFSSTNLAPAALVASVGTALIAASVYALGSVGLYMLYGWTGAIGTWVTIRFWTRLSDTFGMVEARRYFGYIGRGATFGALTGNILGVIVTFLLPAVALLPSAIVSYGLCALIATRLDSALGDVEASRPKPVDTQRTETLMTPYVMTLGVIVLFGSMSLTVLNWIFKAEMAARFSPADLGQAFAIAYLILNAVGVGAQVFLVQRVLRGPGVLAALGALPTVALAAAIIAAFGSVAGGAALGILASGAFKYTLSKSATELLYVPLPRSVRSRVKEGLDIIGGKGGQAAASLLILALLALGGEVKWLLLAFTGVWLAAVLLIRRPYLGLFERSLRGLVVDIRGVPALDVQSLSALVAGLSNPEDGEVLASISLLEHHEMTELIPTLLLYHPSEDVVERALEAFENANDARFVPVAKRILGTTSPRIHAAAARALYQFAPNDTMMLKYLDNFCIATRATTAVFAHERDLITRSDFDARVQTFFDSQNQNGRESLARAARQVNTPAATDVLRRLFLDAQSQVRTKELAVVGLAARKDPANMDLFLGSLSQRTLRSAGVQGIREMGEQAVPALLDALADQSYREVRWMLPALLAEHSPEQSIPGLVRALDPVDGRLSYYALRALESVQHRFDNLQIPQAETFKVFEQTMKNVRSLAAASATIETVDGQANDKVHMLTELLHSKRGHAAERALRLRGLMENRSDIFLILRGLQGPKSTRASALELMDGFVPMPYRLTLRAHFAGQPAQSICTDAGIPLHTSRKEAYRSIAEAPSEVLRILAHSLLEESTVAHLG